MTHWFLFIATGSLLAAGCAAPATPPADVAMPELTRSLAPAESETEAVAPPGPSEPPGAGLEPQSGTDSEEVLRVDFNVTLGPAACAGPFDYCFGGGKRWEGRVFELPGRVVAYNLTAAWAPSSPATDVLELWTGLCSRNCEPIEQYVGRSPLRAERETVELSETTFSVQMHLRERYHYFASATASLDQDVRVTGTITFEK